MNDKGKVDIEMADMVGKTYFKVATWYNEDFGTEKERSENLKHVCAEVIQQILEDTFTQLQGIERTGVKTISKEEAEKSGSGNAGQMFTVNEDTLTKALREKKEK